MLEYRGIEKWAKYYLLKNFFVKYLIVLLIKVLKSVFFLKLVEIFSYIIRGIQ